MSKEGGVVETGLENYVLSIISIVLGVMTPLAGFILAIVVLFRTKSKDGYNPRAKKLAIIGIAVSILLFLIAIFLTNYLGTLNAQILQNAAP